MGPAVRTRPAVYSARALSQHGKFPSWLDSLLMLLQYLMDCILISATISRPSRTLPQVFFILLKLPGIIPEKYMFKLVLVFVMGILRRSSSNIPPQRAMKR
jgi:hypothetical protein